MFVDFFIRRPVFATVCALLIILAGGVVIPTLPIAQFPNLAPPQVSVGSFYTGASAQTVESAVTTPLEQQINGAEGMKYVTSSSGNDSGTGYYRADRPAPPPGQMPPTAVSVITPGYFRVMGMTLREGRDLEARDRFGAPLAAVVNQAFAKQAFPGERPLGRHFKLIWSGGRPGEPAAGGRGPIAGLERG